MKSCRRQLQGFSVIELMIALTLGILVLGGMGQVYLANQKSLSVIDNMGRLQESGRFAIQFMTADLRRAGYWGGNADLDTFDDEGTSSIAPTVNECAANSDTYGLMALAPVIGTNDTAANYGCIGDYLRGDIVVARYASPINVTGAPPDNSLYIRTSLFQGRLFKGNLSGDAANQLVDTPVQWTFPLVANGYYISVADPLPCGAVPALSRIVLNNNGQPVTEELIPGVEQLQVEYGVDTTGDGSINQITNADGVANWALVSLVRVWLLVRSECPEVSHEDTTTYKLGDFDYAVNDSYRRQLYQVTVSLRN